MRRLGWLLALGLLLGAGAASFALFGARSQVSGGLVNSGRLSLDQGQGQWHSADGQPLDQDFIAMPGDELEYRIELQVELEGDNLEARLQVQAQDYLVLDASGRQHDVQDPVASGHYTVVLSVTVPGQPSYTQQDPLEDLQAWDPGKTMITLEQHRQGR